MEGGKLFVRELNEEKSRFNRGPWVESPVTDEEAFQIWQNATRDIERFRGGCIYHCLTSNPNSSWLVACRSQDLRAKIDALTIEFEQALAHEKADRPKVDVKS